MQAVSSEEYAMNPRPNPRLSSDAPAHVHTVSASNFGALVRENDALHQMNDHLLKFVPETVKRRVLAQPEAPDLAMREGDVSVLFLDMSGYARLSQQMSLQALNALVERYFSRFLDCVYEADGDVNEIAGDGLMTIFQDADPLQHPRKAVSASLAMLAATAALNREGREPALDVHMGLNSGLALVGLTCFTGQHGARCTFTARGAMTNLAARLVDLAAPGQILLGPETVRRLGSRYPVQKLGRKRLKNLAEPIDIACLLSPA
jgi:class 3 adenylate cyclase